MSLAAFCRDKTLLLQVNTARQSRPTAPSKGAARQLASCPSQVAANHGAVHGRIISTTRLRPDTDRSACAFSCKSTRHSAWSARQRRDSSPKEHCCGTIMICQTQNLDADFMACGLGCRERTLSWQALPARLGAADHAAAGLASGRLPASTAGPVPQRRPARAHGTASRCQSTCKMHNQCAGLWTMMIKPGCVFPAQTL